MMQSWKMLREKGKMIRKGWKNIGLDQTFDLSFATAVAKKIRSGSMSETGIDEKQERTMTSLMQMRDRWQMRRMIQISQLIYKMMRMMQQWKKHWLQPLRIDACLASEGVLDCKGMISCAAITSPRNCRTRY